LLRIIIPDYDGRTEALVWTMEYGKDSILALFPTYSSAAIDLFALKFYLDRVVPATTLCIIWSICAVAVTLHSERESDTKLERLSPGGCAIDRMEVKRLWQYAIAATEVSTEHTRVWRGSCLAGCVSRLFCNNAVF